jgi:ABC-type sugar transport system ATPase subunit
MAARQSPPQSPTAASVAMTDAAGAAPLLRVANMAKAFGPTQALRDCSFELRPAEVHALVGENGSGKSTLVKILSGVHAPDEGGLEIGGDSLAAIRSPKHAQQMGTVTVFQEVLVAEARSVLDNVWLGYDTLLRAKVPMKEKRALATAALTELLGEPLDLDTPTEHLSLSDRQACCLVRALLRKPRVLILDEATSALDIATRDRLFATVRRLTAEGVGVIFITHRMDEIDELCDRLTVMRSGATIATLERGNWTGAEVVHLMTGSERLTEQAREEADAPAAREGDVVISTRDLRLAPERPPVEIEIRAGELVGLAGLEGHGQETFLEALWGRVPAGGEAIRHGADGEVPLRSQHDAAKQDIAYVPRERGRDSLFRWMSIRENFAIATIGRDTKGGWLMPRRSTKRLSKYVKSLGIVLGDQGDAITTLSGGNQQKVIIGRWLASEPRILLLNDPTRGIDIGAKRDLYKLLTQLASEGLAVVMLSTELDEHIELMDRVLVFREQELVAEIGRAGLTRHTLLGSFFGEKGGVDVASDRSAG